MLEERVKFLIPINVRKAMLAGCRTENTHGFNLHGLWNILICLKRYVIVCRLPSAFKGLFGPYSRKDPLSMLCTLFRIVE